MQVFSQANAVWNSNFNNLFVPFRCVASDIYRKEAVVLSKGDLGDAVRASMTFPIMFKPIRIDSILLFDGGIYNNFPIDVKQNDFKPDYIIGSVVVQDLQKPKDDDIVSNIKNIVMDRTNDTIDPEKGIMLELDLGNVHIFDFSKVDELVRIGYNSTLTKIETIQKQIKSRKEKSALDQQRLDFSEKFPPLHFKNITINGVDSLQQKYIRRVLQHGSDEISIEEFHKGYFILLSDSRIKEIIPHAVYNSEENVFDMVTM